MACLVVLLWGCGKPAAEQSRTEGEAAANAPVGQSDKQTPIAAAPGATTTGEQDAQLAQPEIQASAPDPEILRTMGVGTRIEYLLGPEIEMIISGAVDPMKLVVIREILRNTNENYVHRMRGNDSNTVYVHVDGREGVYDADGKLVLDGFNDGTFNYAHGETYPLEHFVCDMNPWLKYGLSETDPTSIQERVQAYVRDFEGGILGARIAFADGEVDTEIEIKAVDFGTIEALALFIRVLGEEKAGVIYSIVTEPKPIDSAEIISALAAIEQALVKLYSG